MAGTADGYCDSWLRASVPHSTHWRPCRSGWGRAAGGRFQSDTPGKFSGGVKRRLGWPRMPMPCHPACCESTHALTGHSETGDGVGCSASAGRNVRTRHLHARPRAAAECLLALARSILRPAALPRSSDGSEKCLFRRRQAPRGGQHGSIAAHTGQHYAARQCRRLWPESRCIAPTGAYV